MLHHVFVNECLLDYFSFLAFSLTCVLKGADI